jgi:putative two-component system response regulator
MCPEELRDSRILIVEDREENIRFLKRLLEKAGYRYIRATQDSRKALADFRDFRPDLILLDLRMPHMDGFEVMEVLNSEVSGESFLPILVVTADRDPSVKIQCLSVGAKDFLAKPFRAEEVLLRIKNLLETRRLHQFLEVRNETLRLKVEAENSRLQATQLEVLRRLAVAAEYRDDITGRHGERVGALAGLLGDGAGLDPQEVALLREAAPLHDVGKIGIPDAILMKPGRLTEAEFEVMKSHTTIGGMILSKGSFPLLDYAREIALSHHEWWDGYGYPNGLTRGRIPICGRIVAIADVFDSMTHERPYKGAFSAEETLQIMAEEKGHFDPELLELFFDLVHMGLVTDVLARLDPFGPGEGQSPPTPEAASVLDLGLPASPELPPEAKELLWKSLGNV